MNGLTAGERTKLEQIRKLAETDLGRAKGKASAWVRANRGRRGIRRAACRTVPGLFSVERRSTKRWIPDEPIRLAYGEPSEMLRYVRALRDVGMGASDDDAA